MKFTPDRKMIESLRRLPDETLWRLLCAMASGMGGNVSTKKVDFNRIAGVRAVLEHMTDDDIYRLNELIDLYYGAAHSRKA